MTILSILAGAVFFWMKYTLIKSGEMESDNPEFYQYTSIVLMIIFVILVLFMLCFCNRIALAAKLIKTTSKFIT